MNVCGQPDVQIQLFSSLDAVKPSDVRGFFDATHAWNSGSYTCVACCYSSELLSLEAMKQSDVRGYTQHTLGMVKLHMYCILLLFRTFKPGSHETIGRCVLHTAYLEQWKLHVCCMILLTITLCVCCLLYTSPSPRDLDRSRMPSSA